MNPQFVRVLPAMLACAFAACSTPGAPSGTPTATAATPPTLVEDTSASIQGGAVDRADGAVGLVWIASGGFCSGTLVAPNAVLTAGHCVEDLVSAFYTGTGRAQTSVGDPASTMEQHVVVDRIAHPSYRATEQCPNPSYDVALLRLAQPITTLSPVPLATRAPAAAVDCRAVGYGRHDTTTHTTVEQRRVATETVAGAGKTWVEAHWKSGLVDHGDSGGPLLCDGAIVGVTSCGSVEADEAFYGRVDNVAAWVRATIAGWR